jgi:deoxyadenosine/deoxycytidine kinase
MSKQTAMDWFLENLKEYSTPSIIEIYWDEFNQLFEQAKEMEKNQIINIFKDAQVFKVMNNKTRAEQYYNETYGGNK